MKSFLPNYINNLSVPLSLSIILDFCSRAQGREGLWEQQKPEILNALTQQAIISSTESSNRIEGVEIESDRLAPLVNGKVAPKDRSEEEVLGYKHALDWIHNNYEKIEINSETIKHLHFLSQEGNVPDAGQWKNKNNEIIEILPNGESRVRFIPSAAEDVPKLVENLSLAYKDAIKNSKLPDILLVATCVFDFLCIHPFRDGNGRTSRLLTLLLLYKCNFKLGKYISIEKVVEDSKENYYSALQQSSVNWHTSEHDIVPFWHYFTRILKISYERLENKFQVESTFRGGKTQLIRNSIMRQVGNFKVSDIMSLEKGTSRELIQKVLASMREEGLIELHGRGRGAYWKKK